MKTLTRLSAVLAGAIILSCMLACGAVGRVREAADRVKTQNDLKQIGLALHSFHDKNRRGPNDMNELLQFAQKDAPEAVPPIQQTGPGGKFVVLYGSWKIPGDFPDGTTNTVLGYESQVPSKGGPVLFADGSVRVITAAEFAQAPKAKSQK